MYCSLLAILCDGMVVATIPVPIHLIVATAFVLLVKLYVVVSQDD